MKTESGLAGTNLQGSELSTPAVFPAANIDPLPRTAFHNAARRRAPSGHVSG